MPDFLTTLVPLAAISAIAWLTPGPNMVAVMGASLTRGRAHGVAMAAGLTAAATVWVILALAGAAFVFDLFPRAVLMLKLAGAGYLIWLGLKSLRAAARTEGQAAARPPAPAPLRRSVRSGFLVSITNPKSALFFSSVFAAFVPPDATPQTLAAIGAACSLQTFVQHAATATLFSTRPATGAFLRFGRRIQAGFGTLYIAAGISVAASALRR